MRRANRPGGYQHDMFDDVSREPSLSGEAESQHKEGHSGFMVTLSGTEKKQRSHSRSLLIWLANGSWVVLHKKAYTTSLG